MQGQAEEQRRVPRTNAESYFELRSTLLLPMPDERMYVALVRLARGCAQKCQLSASDSVPRYVAEM